MLKHYKIKHNPVQLIMTNEKSDIKGLPFLWDSGSDHKKSNEYCAASAAPCEEINPMKRRPKSKSNSLFSLESRNNHVKENK